MTSSLALLTLLLIWVIGVAAGGVFLAVQPFGPLATSEPLKSVPPVTGIAAAALCLITLFVAVVVRRLFPVATLPATMTAGAIAILAAAISTRSLVALLAIAAMTMLAWLMGNAALRFLPATSSAAIVTLPLAVSLGLGLLGLLLFLPAAASQLNVRSVSIVALAGLGFVWVVDRDRIVDRFAQLRRWRPQAPSWFETIVIGMAVGLVTLGLLTAFAPEDQTDAMRQHLPIAREIWQSGSLAEFAPMSVSRRPMQAHLLYAVAYSFGGMAAAKFVAAAVGLVAVVAVAGIGWLCAGRLAATIGAAVFATMPLVMWELGHAFIDLFPVLFTVSAVLCILLWQEDGAVSWLLAAGALSGFGIAAKLTMGLVSAALVAAIFLVGRSPWTWQERVQAALAFALGNAVVVPWLLRTYAITDAIPGLDTVRLHFARFFPQSTPRVTEPVMLETVAEEGAGGAQAISNIGFGHTPLDLLRGLWVLTFDGKALGYPIIGRGEIGILPLTLLPLALLGPRTRQTALLALTAFLSYCAWWLSSYQIARHLLPTLALVAALGGIGLASVIASAASWPRRVLAGAAQGAVVFGMVAVPLFFAASPRAILPLDFLTGRETAAEYVEHEVAAAHVLAAASKLLPPDTPVAYVSVDWEGPQLYTETRLVYVPVTTLGATAEEVRANLERLGLRYLIWNREESTPAQWRSTLLTGSFLRDYGRILAGDRNAYLIELLPQAGLSWKADHPQNLLTDTQFARVGRKGSPWSTDGKIGNNGNFVSISAKSTVSQQVAVHGGHAYLLQATGNCARDDDRTNLGLQWLDEGGRHLGEAAEMVVPGRTSSAQFIWRPAPAGAASVVVTLGAAKGASCKFTTLALYDLGSP